MPKRDNGESLEREKMYLEATGKAADYILRIISNPVIAVVGGIVATSILNNTYRMGKEVAYRFNVEHPETGWAWQVVETRPVPLITDQQTVLIQGFLLTTEAMKAVAASVGGGANLAKIIAGL